MEFSDIPARWDGNYFGTGFCEASAARIALLPRGGRSESDTSLANCPASGRRKARAGLLAKCSSQYCEALSSSGHASSSRPGARGQGRGKTSFTTRASHQLAARRSNSSRDARAHSYRPLRSSAPASAVRAQGAAPFSATVVFANWIRNSVSAMASGASSSVHTK